MKYYLKQNEIEVTNVEYNEEVLVYVDITQTKYDKLLEASEKYELNFALNRTEIIKEKYIVI